MTREEIVEKVNEFLIEDFEIEEDRLVGSNHSANRSIRSKAWIRKD